MKESIVKELGANVKRTRPYNSRAKRVLKKLYRDPGRNWRLDHARSDFRIDPPPIPATDDSDRKELSRLVRKVATVQRKDLIQFRKTCGADQAVRS